MKICNFEIDMRTELRDIFVKKNVFQELGTDRIGVFGSWARGENYNNIDLLLDADPRYVKREMLKKLIEDEFKIPCNVVVKNKLEPVIIHYINKDIEICPGRINHN